MKIKINNTTLTESNFVNFFHKLSIITTLSLFMLKLFVESNISWFLILFCLISSLYFNKLINSYK